VSSAPEKRVLPALASAGLEGRFDAVVTADDVYRGSPDPEGYLYAAQRLQRPPMRCVVIGSSNLSIEAAHEVRGGASHAAPRCAVLCCALNERLVAF
jgi:beta-phosphoglucomutase-like phosphatase (HAD superfamily)